MTHAAEISYALSGKKLGAGWMARCPAHDDRTPSLSVTQMGDVVLVHCFAGCDQVDVIDALRAMGLWHNRTNIVTESLIRKSAKRDTAMRQEARMRAKAMWQKATPNARNHPYLKEKRVGAFGVRDLNGTLLIPLRDSEQVFHSVQMIGDDGSKTFLRGGLIKGCYHAIGRLNGIILIAEGYATSATLHESTCYAVACAFNAGNLKPVAIALRGKFPKTRLVICADNDGYGTIGNPGVTQASEAAKAVGGVMVKPVFRDVSKRPTDFNDLARMEGLERVREIVLETVAYA